MQAKTRRDRLLCLGVFFAVSLVALGGAVWSVVTAYETTGAGSNGHVAALFFAAASAGAVCITGFKFTGAIYAPHPAADAGERRRQAVRRVADNDDGASDVYDDDAEGEAPPRLPRPTMLPPTEEEMASRPSRASPTPPPRV